MLLHKKKDNSFFLNFLPSPLSSSQSFIHSITLNAEIVARRKCWAHLMSRKFFRDLRDIFYTRHLVFHHCVTLNESKFFFKRIFFS